MGERRVRRMKITWNLLSDLVAGAAIPARETNAPPDLAVVWIADADPLTQNVTLYVESASFDPVPEGAEIPWAEAYWYRNKGK